MSDRVYTCDPILDALQDWAVDGLVNEPDAMGDFYVGAIHALCDDGWFV